jgi:putative membrane protein
MLVGISLASLAAEARARLVVGRALAYKGMTSSRKDAMAASTSARGSTSCLIVSTALVLLLAYSGLHPFDRTTWILEVFPIFVALPVLWATCKRFPLTNLAYALIFCHAVVLMVGGAYSYARVPLGFEIANFLGVHRNPYDKIGHFFQGFVPAVIAREILIRGRYLRRGKMMTFLVICVVLAISATYELVEWAAAVALGQGADEFLGTQGDPWDTQSDMLFALIGGIAAMMSLPRWHDKQIERVVSRESAIRACAPRESR